jgi:replicative DNA helicase
MEISNNLLLKNYLNKNMNFLFEFNGKKILGATSGIKIVDNVTEGFFGLTALTGVPGKGKTTFAIQSVIHNIFQEQTPTIYVSLEVSKDMFISKIISHLIHVPVKKILKGQLNEQESEDYIEALEKLLNNEFLLILDTTEASLENIRKSIDFMGKHMYETFGISTKPLIVLDYLNIFYDYGDEGKAEKDKQDKVSRQMAELIKIKNTTKSNFIIITAKNKSGYKVAELSSIKGPNDLEYGFETILSLEDVDEDFPIAEFAENKETGFRSVNTLMVVMKNRWGENSKRIPLDFNGKYGIFTEPILNK